jgi:hypothetical protein
MNGNDIEDAANGDPGEQGEAAVLKERQLSSATADLSEFEREFLKSLLQSELQQTQEILKLLKPGDDPWVRFRLKERIEGSLTFKPN